MPISKGAGFVAAVVLTLALGWGPQAVREANAQSAASPKWLLVLKIARPELQTPAAGPL